MKKLNNKKGFTLAELLIVVAIIAVLTAIAVPLFVGALNNAEESVKDANIRAVRSEAVSKILLAKEPAATVEDDPNGIFVKTGGETGAFTHARGTSWNVTAIVSKSGAVLKLTFSPNPDTSAAFKSDTCEDYKKDDDASFETIGKYTVKLYLKVDDLAS